jgi:transposase
MKCKKIFDGRQLPRKAKEQLRVAAVKRVESGESPEAVAAGLGINRRTIYRWIEAFHYGGEPALKAKPIPGAPPKLDAKQMARLARIVSTKNPLQLNFEFALWTLAMIRVLIRREFAVSLSEVSVGRLMRRLGFSAQRPLYRAWQQDPALVERWRAEDYPKIAARAKQEGALIFFADESGIRSDHHAGTTWGPVGQTPVVTATGARYGLNMLSAVNALGHFRFMTVEGRVNASVFRDFLKRLITGMERKIFLIVDGHPAHKAKLVSRFVADNAQAIELFFLPPYAPELNPDELAWGHIKTRIAKATVQTKQELKAMVDRVMRRLQRMPEIVAGFFHAPTCAYARV